MPSKSKPAELSSPSQGEIIATKEKKCHVSSHKAFAKMC